jgi:hypothetical protein
MCDDVHFEGIWTEEDLGTVSAVIRRTEARLEAPPSPAFGKAWICVREEVDDVRVLYSASRYGFHATLKALTAGTLAGRIEEFADVAVPYADPW